MKEKLPMWNWYKNSENEHNSVTIFKKKDELIIEKDTKFLNSKLQKT